MKTERLTKRIDTVLGMPYKHYDIPSLDCLGTGGNKEDRKQREHEIVACIDKLGQKEDDDEKLGIDSHIVFQALVNGAYAKKFNEIYYYKIVGLKRLQDGYYLLAKENYLNGGDFKLYLKSYGNDWALTREELK